jgi:hypothetical protein
VKATGKGAVNLVVHPIDSAKGVGTAVGKLGRGIGGLFRKREEGEKSSFGETVMGGSKRELASQLGVDAYTDNPYLQELLDSMAKKRMTGKGAVMIAKILIPVGLIVSAALTVSGVNASADEYIKDKSRGELFYENKKALEALGFSKEEINSLLNLAYYTPRDETYMRFYLERLQNVRGSRELLRVAVKSTSLMQARKLLYAAQMVADSFDESKPYVRMKIFDEGIAAEAHDRVILFTSYDYLDSSPLGDRVRDRTLEAKQLWAKGAAEIRNGGKVTGGYASALFLKGIRIRDWVLFQQAS